MSRPRDYAAGIAHMRKLERAQREMRQAKGRGVIALVDGLVFDPALGLPHAPLPVAAQAVLQRELNRNADVLTDMHVALAFCRNRRRPGNVPTSDRSPYGVKYWIGVLSNGTGWTKEEAVQGQYDRWAAWCNDPTTCPETGRPMPRDPDPPVPWQKEFLRRERKLRQARKAARKAAQGRVPEPLTTEQQALDAVTAAGLEVAVIHGASVTLVEQDGAITVLSNGGSP